MRAMPDNQLTDCPICYVNKISKKCANNHEGSGFEGAHIVSHQHGGRASLDNLIPSCHNCNHLCGPAHLLQFMSDDIERRSHVLLIIHRLYHIHGAAGATAAGSIVDYAINRWSSSGFTARHPLIHKLRLSSLEEAKRVSKAHRLLVLERQRAQLQRDD
jgi:hypothetical protein